MHRELTGASGTSSARTGTLYGFAAYLLWGLLPFYFLTLAPSGAWEILLHRILWSALLCTVLTVALRRWSDTRSLSDELEEMKTRFEARKSLDRAKGLLTTKLGLDEQAAFRWIQKTAMDRRLSMQQVCDGVIAEFGD